MAHILCLGSSSAGNSYVVSTADGYLLIEAGVRPHEVLKACGYERNRIKGLLVSHQHKDHARYIGELAEFGIPDFFAPEEVLQTLPDNVRKHSEQKQWVSIGPFKVLAFPLMHDVPNYGYIIRHPEFGSLFFGTDTYAYGQIFRGIDNFLIEANYSDDILAESNIDPAQRNRLLTSHMSLDYAVKYLHECHAENAYTITLIHLSSRHSDAVAFQRRIQNEFCVPCTIADKGVIIDISKNLL